jgi:thiamine pyrophosphate-dependent acetolactate synthase large subunit-like protein
MTRLDALREILAACPDDPVVGTCGATIRELASLGVRDNCLYMQNSMGLAGPIGLGLALGHAAPEHGRVVVIEGDGGTLMGLSQLGTLALLRPASLVLAVLDNGVHASTGGQPTAAGALDLAAVFAAAGCCTAQAEDEAGLHAALAAARAAPGPWMLHVRIAPGNAPLPYYQEDPAVIAQRFAAFLAR